MNKDILTGVKIGTSGIVVPGPKTEFPENFKSSSRLHYYSSLFNSLEINSSFYKIPMAKTFEKWTTEVPNDFMFTVKCWRGITHAKHLQFAGVDVNLFMQAIVKLGSKAGCLLIQFPASITIHYLAKVENLLSQISSQNSGHQFRLAIELRHISWYCDAAYKMFEKYDASVVSHDMPGSSTPSDAFTTQYKYLRFHGPAGNYKGSYDSTFIQEVADKIIQHRKNGFYIYAYFNNTMGAAFENAILLDQLIREEK